MRSNNHKIHTIPFNLIVAMESRHIPLPLVESEWETLPTKHTVLVKSTQKSSVLHQAIPYHRTFDTGLSLLYDLLKNLSHILVLICWWTWTNKSIRKVEGTHSCTMYYFWPDPLCGCLLKRVHPQWSTPIISSRVRSSSLKRLIQKQNTGERNQGQKLDNSVVVQLLTE